MISSEITNKMLNGDIYSLAKVISAVERTPEKAGEIMQSVFPHCHGAKVVGITGPPGAGKSSLIYHLAKTLSDKNKKVAVLAVDPNSHLTGGALLGDRIRMDDLKHVYIRSIGNRCQMGGISSAAYFITKILEACKYEYIFIETVGAGQSEVKIKDLADLTMLILAPGLGDDIQANKAGIMEIGNVLVVNKADKQDAESLRIQLQDMLNTAAIRQSEVIPVFLTDCINGKGFDELIEHISSALEQKGGIESEVIKLKHQYGELLENKIIKYINEQLKNRNDADEIIKKVLDGKQNFTELLEEDIKSFIK